MHTVRRVWFLLAPVIAIGNSVCLVCIYLRGFLLGDNTSALVRDFNTPFFTIPIMFLSLLAIDNFQRKTFLYKGTHWLARTVLIIGFYGVLAAFIVAFVVLLYMRFGDDSGRSVNVLLSLILELAAITYAIGREKRKKIISLFKVLFLWSFSIMGSFSAIGLFEKFYPVTLNDDLRIIFSGIFFHLCNSCYLVYALAVNYRNNSSKKGTVIPPWKDTL